MGSRQGFISTEWGSHSTAQPGATLSIDTGGLVRNLVFRLSPQAVVAGRLTDAEGNPVANVQVWAIRDAGIHGKKQLFAAGHAATDDRGEYRIAGLAAGRYYVSAIFPPAILQEAPGDSVDNQSDQAYVPTYYPGTADASLAIPLQAVEGVELPRVDFALSKTHTVRIRGQVLNGETSERSVVTVVLVPRENAAGAPTSRSLVTNPDGSFAIAGVAPGIYTLIASIFKNGRYTTAKKSIDATDDVDDFTITVAPGVDVPGSLQVEGTVKPSRAALQLSLLSDDPGEPLFPQPNTPLKEDGGFTFSNVASGHYRLAALGLPDGYYMKAVRLGENDVLDAGFDVVQGQTPLTITIVLAQGAADVTGVVRDAKGQLSVGALVVLVLEGRGQPQNYRVATTDQYGRFALRNVAPGPYKVFAPEGIELSAVDLILLKQIEDQGESILIQASSHPNVGLRLIPTEDLGQR
jgi:hypothetical protein